MLLVTPRGLGRVKQIWVVATVTWATRSQVTTVTWAAAAANWAAATMTWVAATVRNRRMREEHVVMVLLMVEMFVMITQLQYQYSNSSRGRE
jgi:hypothetical protein